VEIVAFLIPVSLFLGGLGLVAFLWTMRSKQYDDPEGGSQRILSDEWDDKPRP